MGLMQGLELVADETVQDRTPAPEKAVRLFEETKKRGLLIGKGGLYGNVIRISPPLDRLGVRGGRRPEDPRRVARRLGVGDPCNPERARTRLTGTEPSVREGSP